MSDLISRSELIKHFEAIQQQENVVGLEFIAMIDEIKEQPTAYDVDKVVGELKIIKEDALAEYNMGEYNLDNNIGNSIAENYRKDMNEGKCFAYDEAIEIVKQEAEQYNNGWVPCSVELPPQPVENPIFDNKPLELYLVSVKNADYPIRAFWNGKFFTDGWSKVDVIAWQPLQKPYHPKGE